VYKRQALLNPRHGGNSAAARHPVVLPYAAIDFDDQTKVRNAVDMSGCLVRYPRHASLCVAIGNNPWAGGFIYVAGTFASGELISHSIGDERLDGAHRLRVTASLRGETYRWLAPFEMLTGDLRSDGVRGRFTGYVERDEPNYRGARPVTEFRGWVWQSGRCLDEAQPEEDCERRSFFSLRLPVAVLRDALFQQGRPEWPPADLEQFDVRVQLLPPGEGAPLFDSEEAGAQPTFSLGDLAELLLPGETLAIEKLQGGKGVPLFGVSGKEAPTETVSPLLTRVIRLLPVDSYSAPVELVDEVATPLGAYRIRLHGDARGVNQTLSVVASRLSWLVGAMLAAITAAWLAIEIGMVRRIARLTRRTRGLSGSVNAEGGLERYQLADLRGSDELGLLAGGLDDLLRRVREDAERERIRAGQEKDMWHAVGHEIMSPLQSLLALHGSAEDPSHRYIQRMQQAVRVLYGSASPSEAFESSRVQVEAVDIADFLRKVAENAGIADVRCSGADAPVLVRADPFPLEDVFAHLLKNADRHRLPGSPITLSLAADESTATVGVHNAGQPIAPDMLDKIFEYGVSDHPEAGAQGNRGQGLFVAKTYMAKMGGTVAARNVDDGVVFELTLPRVRTA
jgi:signal transduction histidine kinase